MIVDGLSWWQSWLCVWIGYTLAALFVVALGRLATIYHIPFAVANRASFGIWGSFWPIINRAAMAVIWYGVQVGTLTLFEGYPLIFDSHISGVRREPITVFFDLHTNINR